MNQPLASFLSEMGLTEYEAKTLAALFHLKEAESPEVSRAAQVPKTRVYDVLDKLVERGLAIPIFSRPKKYRALDTREVFTKLMQAKRGQLEVLENRAKEWEATLANQTTSSAQNEENIFKVKSRGDFYKILAQEIDTAHQEVIGLTALDVHHPILHDSLRRAAQRDVEVKLAGEHPNSFLEALPHLGADHKIHAQHAHHGLHAYIIDGKKVVMMLSDIKKDQPEYHFSIWNHHPPLAETLRHQFDRVWNPPAPI
ncbi:MAG: helix-turn-helix domain-containing protein [Candidatus Diapherotrites archaeon]|nr:helix-turn-helix domain-containing protein [Candidatus Diapherotrites archaeon]MDZ4256914.1 helix-turn-helix domain-containing protein [archaeon]